MGNDVKSRLHIHKKHDHHGHKNDGNDSAKDSSANNNQVDQTIMSGPNRARAAQSGAGSGDAPASGGRDAADSASNPTTATRGRN